MRGSPRQPHAPLAFLALAAALVACGDVQAPDSALAPEDAAARLDGPAAVEASGQFIAHLTGAEEVTADGTGVDTRAQGQATFRLSSDGSELSYRLITANIVNVRMAHIHWEEPGENGPIVVWLYPDAPPPVLIPGRSDGVLATGVITADDLVGLLAGKSLDDLVALMRAGETYVNVHTVANPGGEIRGQIR